MRARLMAASAIWLLAAPALGQQVGNTVVFGDSLSDPGNTPGLSGGVNFPPSPPYVGNRFSNGPVFSELLPGLLGGRFDPSLNFAVGGALTGGDNLNSNRPSALPGSDLTGVVLPGMETQVDGFLAGGGQLDPDDLVIVFGGANDIFVAAETAATLPADDVPDLVRSTAATSAANLATSVVKLNAVGGETFVLPNLPDVGATPNFTAGGPDSIALGTGFTRAHNVALNQAAADLQDQTGVNIFVFDVNGIFNDIQTNPERYGITNTSDACIDDLACVVADQETQNEFLFFDGVHPTTGVHAQVAEILAASLGAPATIAAQGDVSLFSVEDFQQAMIASFNPPAAAASTSLAAGRKTRHGIDTADGKSHGEALDRPTDLFVQIDYTDGDRETRAGATGYDFDAVSLTAGLRRKLNDMVTIGGALRFGGGDVDLEGGSDRFEHRQTQLGVSVTWGDENRYMTALADIGYAEIRDIERATGVDGVDAEGSTDGLIFGAGLAIGHLFDIGRHVRVGPLGSILYNAVELESYVEDGPSFASQSVDDQEDVDSLLASIGGAIEFDLDHGYPGSRDNVRLRLSGFLDYDMRDSDRTIETAFVTSPTTLTTNVKGLDRTTGRLGLDIAIAPVQGIDLGLGVESLVGDESGDAETVFGRATISF